MMDQNLSEFDFSKYILELISKRTTAKALLLQDELTNLWKWNRTEAVLCLIQCSNDLVLFPDKEITERFQFFGLSNKFLKWFIDINEIITLLKKIEANDIEVDLHVVLGLIHFHLSIKSVNELIKGLGGKSNFNRKSDTNIVYKLGVRAYERMANPSKRAKPKPDLMVKAITEIENKVEDFDEAYFRSIILNSLKAKTERYFIKDLIENGFIHKHSQTEFFVIIYELMQLILKDRQLFSEENYDKYGNSKYDSFRRYQVGNLRTIIYGKQKPL